MPAGQLHPSEVRDVTDQTSGFAILPAVGDRP